MSAKKEQAKAARDRKMKKVLIIEAQMKQYRAPFYAELYECLRKQGIQQMVAYSAPSREELCKSDNCELPEKYGRKVKAYRCWQERLLFQPLFREIRAADLVVIDQSNKLVLAHFLILLSRLGLKRVAFWGHGENKQGDRATISERYKRFTLNWVTWWFAYTAGTAEYLQQQGVPDVKITIVQNSIDTRMIRECVRNLGADAKAALRAQMGLDSQATIGIFVGALNKVKSLSFLLEASHRIRRSVPDFHLIVVGSGPEEAELRASAIQHPWIHFLGAKFGQDKAELLEIADLFLLPGAVGLAILDSFAAGLPLLTTSISTHGPEIEYLVAGHNGIMTAHAPETYANAAIRLLSCPDELRALREGAMHTAEKYSIEHMVENFSEGIFRCLQQPKRRRTKDRKAEQDRSNISIPGIQAARGDLQDANASQPSLVKNVTNNTFGKAEQNTLVTTSWDDGHPLDLRVAELLRRYGLQGTFYVPRSGQRKVMSSSELRELSAEFELGGHTLDHLPVDRLSDVRLSEQLSGSREWLEEVTGKSCRVFCFPGGRFRKPQLRLVRQAGFRAVRTVELLSTSLPECIEGLYVLPTSVQVYPRGPLAYARNALKRFSAPSRLLRYSVLFSADWRAPATDLFFRSLKHGGVFHLWGHSWEIEEQGQWANLEKFLGFVRSWRGKWEAVTNGQLCEPAAHVVPVERGPALETTVNAAQRRISR
ncbi:MAG TPA: glycosyltransferase [Candidatus Acidoferrum sp.]|nr:glycosyltransferase [Candidatus Acidoferrum sp.]